MGASRLYHSPGFTQKLAPWCSVVRAGIGQSKACMATWPKFRERYGEPPELKLGLLALLHSYVVFGLDCLSAVMEERASSVQLHCRHTASSCSKQDERSVEHCTMYHSINHAPTKPNIQRARSNEEILRQALDRNLCLSVSGSSSAAAAELIGKAAASSQGRGSKALKRCKKEAARSFTMRDAIWSPRHSEDRAAGSQVPPVVFQAKTQVQRRMALVNQLQRLDAQDALCSAAVAWQA